MLKADGFDDCILGSVWVGDEEVLAYDQFAIIKSLHDNQDMDWNEAEEYFHFNIKGAYMGPTTPIYIDTTWDEEDMDAT